MSLSLATVLCLCWCCCVALARFVEEMGSDGYQTQRRSSWVLGKERAEKVLAVAPLFGLWDPCENPWLQPDDWNSSPRSEWQGGGPGGDSGASVNDPNVLVWLIPTGPNDLGGLFNGPNVRERSSQPTNAPCQFASLPLGSKNTRRQAKPTCGTGSLSLRTTAC